MTLAEDVPDAVAQWANDMGLAVQYDEVDDHWVIINEADQTLAETYDAGELLTLLADLNALSIVDKAHLGIT